MMPKPFRSGRRRESLLFDGWYTVHLRECREEERRQLVIILLPATAETALPRGRAVVLLDTIPARRTRINCAQCSYIRKFIQYWVVATESYIRLSSCGGGGGQNAANSHAWMGPTGV
jgi:hypothetical protein